MVAGIFDGEIDFDPGQGVDFGGTTDTGGMYPPTGFFVARYTAEGSLVWAKSAKHTPFSPGMPAARISALMVGENDAIYVAGAFRESLDFDLDGGTQTRSPVGQWDGFILELDSAGVYQDLLTIASGGVDVVTGLAFDSTGSVVVAGQFGGDNTEFDPGAGTTEADSVGLGDVFVARYGSSFELEWLYHGGTTATDTLSDVTVLSNDSIFAVGWVNGNGSPDFDPLTDPESIAYEGSTDPLILRLGADGSFEDVYTFGGSNVDLAVAVDHDPDDNVYISGYFRQPVDFNPGPGTDLLPNSIGDDVFLTSYSGVGSYRWTVNLGNDENNQAITVVADDFGSIYLGGFYQGTLDFDPGTDAVNRTSTGLRDAFVSRFDSTGVLEDTWVFGSTGTDETLALDINASRELTAAGTFAGSIDLDPREETEDSFTAVGSTDAFFLRLVPEGQ